MSKPTLLTSMLIPMAILGFSLSSAVNLASGLFRLLRTKTWLSGLSDSGQPFASYSRARPLLAGGSSQPPHTQSFPVLLCWCVFQGAPRTEMLWLPNYQKRLWASVQAQLVEPPRSPSPVLIFSCDPVCGMCMMNLNIMLEIIVSTGRNN